MLRRLSLKDYGLVESAEIEFSKGATIFTGETGSGKTMVLGALGFALGERANADAVRRGAARATVTLAFEPDDALRERLCADGFELDPGEEASIVREVSEAGKSSVRVNGRASTASYVRELAARIAEIVGQHEAQRLLAAPYHLELLDRHAGAGALRLAVAAAHELCSIRKRDLEALESDERRARDRYDDARFAVDELDGLALKAGEDERLNERRRYLDNVEKISGALRTAHEALAADEASAGSLLGTAASSLGTISEMSEELAEMAAQARGLQSEATDLATRIGRLLDTTEFDAAELEAINGRLDAIDRAKRKYAPSIEELLRYLEDARATVSEFETRDERRAELREALSAAESGLQTVAGELTALRKSAAATLSRQVEAEFADLALAAGRFEAALVPVTPIGSAGAETAEFRFAANAGEPLRPLSRVASGGELSRVLLALVVVVAAARDRSALVFDEIDAGIGGATATAVGVRLGRLARDGQVACVTHLAQLATWAQRHYVLEKTEARGQTTIRIRELAGDEERAAELARMLSGESHDAALEHARTLLRAAK